MAKVSLTYLNEYLGLCESQELTKYLEYGHHHPVTTPIQREVSNDYYTDTLVPMGGTK